MRNVQPRGLLLDIDGTVLDSGRLIEGAGAAIATLRARGVPLLFATNTSRKSRAAVARSLRDVGLAVNDAEVLSASAAAAVTLRARGVRKLCALLAPAALPDFDGFELVSAGADAVVVGDMGSAITFDLLNSAFRCLLDGARLVATHRNRYWKADDGLWTIDAGAFVAALEYAAQVEAELVGKPAPSFFRAAADVLGLAAQDLAIVGDDLEADIGGGRAAGLTTFAVRTGKFRDEHLATVSSDRTPHRVLDSVADAVAFFPG